MMSKHRLKCTGCGEKFNVNLFDSINVTLNPYIIKMIYEGKFNSATCPKCDITYFVTKEFLFHDMKKGILSWIKPEEMDYFFAYLKEKGYFKNVDKIKYQNLDYLTDKKHSSEKSIIDWIKNLKRKSMNKLIKQQKRVQKKQK